MRAESVPAMERGPGFNDAFWVGHADGVVADGTFFQLGRGRCRWSLIFLVLLG